MSERAVRGRDGEVAYYPLIENDHLNGILRRSIAPVEAPKLQALAEQTTNKVM